MATLTNPFNDVDETSIIESLVTELGEFNTAAANSTMRWWFSGYLNSVELWEEVRRHRVGEPLQLPNPCPFPA